MVCRNEERYLEQQRKGTAQCHDRFIVLLPVILRKDHEALVLLERFFDMADPFFHLVLFFPVCRLKGISSFVKRKYEQLDKQAHKDDGDPGVGKKLHRKGKDRLDEDLDRINEKQIQKRRDHFSLQYALQLSIITQKRFLGA